MVASYKNQRRISAWAAGVITSALLGFVGYRLWNGIPVFEGFSAGVTRHVLMVLYIYIQSLLISFMPQESLVRYRCAMSDGGSGYLWGGWLLGIGAIECWRVIPISIPMLGFSIACFVYVFRKWKSSSVVSK